METTTQTKEQDLYRQEVIRQLKKTTEFSLEKINLASNRPIYRFFKRLLDFFAGFFGLLVLLLPMAIISLGIAFTSKGPVIYKQERLGLHGKVFYLYKFRSMVCDAEKNGAKWADKDDPRVTKFGRFLRKSRLDEIPQLWNILVGHMSLVGPRPERAIFYEEFEKYIHGFSQRLIIKPGLTGLAQVNGGYDLKPEEKIMYDIEYIKKRSFWLDIKIILKTVLIVFNHKGAR